MKFSIVAFLCLAAVCEIYAQQPATAITDGGPADLSKLVRSAVTVPKFSSPPTIDGKLDDEVWRSAAVLRDLIQTSPGDHLPASQRTEVLIGYDPSNFYIAFKCWDDKDKIRTSVVQRDRVYGEDNVQFWLDTFNDQRRAYAFAVNPLGIQQDGVQTESQGTDYNVDVVFESKGVIEDWGWSVEIKIPFKSIRYAAGKDKFWGFNAARLISRGNPEFNSWVPLPRGVPGFMNKFGKLTGMNEIKGSRTLEVIPTVTLKQTGTRTSLTHFSNPPIQPDFGFTATYSITPNITLDAAYNPDFADTEADAPVVAANQRFPIFFSEKRPFFLEGVDIFNTAIQAVYTRRIENPDVAFKLTGKVGKTSFGILGAVDDPLFNPPDKKAYAGVFRIKRDIGKESSIGFLVTSYSYPEKHSHLGGFDGRWKINKSTSLSGQVLTSVSTGYFKDEMDRYSYGVGKGAAYDVSFSYRSRHYSVGGNSQGVTDRFRAALGFTRQTDTMSHFVYVNLNPDPTPKKLIVYRFAGANCSRQNTFSNRLQGWGCGINGSLEFKGNTSVGGGFSFGPSIIYEDEFGPRRTAERPGAFFGEPTRRVFGYGPYTYFYKQFNKRLSVNGNYSTGFNRLDYDFGAGRDYPRVSPAVLRFGPGAPLDPGPARSHYVGAGFSAKPTDKFSLGASYSRSSLRRNDTKLLTYESNYFSASSTYQFTRFVNLKARLYYETLSDRITGQYVFAWTPSVGKSIYVGYNNTLGYKGYAFNEPQTGFLQFNRTFFVKMSYLFRRNF